MKMITADDSAPKREESAVPMSVVEFLDAVEEPLKDQYLPEARGKTIYASLLGTAADLSPVDNVKVHFILYTIFSLTCLFLKKDTKVYKIFEFSNLKFQVLKGCLLKSSHFNSPKPWRVLIPSFQIEWKLFQLPLLPL